MFKNTEVQPKAGDRRVVGWIAPGHLPKVFAPRSETYNPDTWPYVSPRLWRETGLGAHPARVRSPEEYPPSHTAAPVVRAARDCVLRIG